MFSRIRQLAASCGGRKFGWFIEWNGAVVGELIDCQYDEMFWDSYQIIPASKEAWRILNTADYWYSGQFRFRNKILDEFAEYPFCAGSGILADGRVLMRGLYLLPQGRVEQALMRICCLFNFPNSVHII